MLSQNVTEIGPIIELKERTKLFLQKKGVTVNNNYASLKDALSILYLDSPVNVEKIGAYPECRGEGRYAMIPIEYLPFIVINAATGGLKRLDARKAVKEYIDFIGIPMPSIWSGEKFYIVQHNESRKFKVGITLWPMDKRLQQISRYHDGTFSKCLVIPTNNASSIEKNFKRAAEKFKTTPPNNPNFAVGKSEWYKDVPAIQNFIRKHRKPGSH